MFTLQLRWSDIAGLAFALLAVILNRSAIAGGALTEAYVDPSYFQRIAFGQHSHWAQPWRSYMQTTSASVFVDGTGLDFNVDAKQAQKVARMISKYGIHHARIEIPWGAFDYDDESKLNSPALTLELQALRQNGLRPLVLLNSNSGAPCPMMRSTRTVSKLAVAESTTISLTDVAGLIPGLSGFSDIGGKYFAAGIMIVSIDRNVLHLSKPLPFVIKARTKVNFATLKYRPFDAGNPISFNQTLEGWKRYVFNVSRIVRSALGTERNPDGGFDLEIWNELTFGSEFLSVDNYYASRERKVTAHLDVYSSLLNATLAVVRSQPKLFSGAQIGDGFSNTIPWPSSSTEPNGVTAVDKHPYKQRVFFPRDDQTGQNLDADYEPSGFVPTYSALFPEYFGTAIQTETLVRDMGPFTNSIYGTLHGRDARRIRGRVAPVRVWITEANIWPNADKPTITAAGAMALKAKLAARYFTFFLNKGVTQLDLFAARDSDTGAGIVTDKFLAFADQSTTAYPRNEDAFVSPALRVVRRIVGCMQQGLSRKSVTMRQFKILKLSARTNAIMFRGDGTRLHPDLHAADVFTFLPYEVNKNRFVIPYYVMTRDVMRSFKEDKFGVVVAGLPKRAKYSVFDPFTDTTVHLNPDVDSQRGITLHLLTTDYPRLLIVDAFDQDDQ